MNCPHCGKAIHAFTGLQELQKFQKHLNKCRKNPDNHITDGRTSVPLGKRYSLTDALNVRAKSGQ
jgi:hypothetical protein